MIITQTPLRVSFLGGNTDFKDFYSKHEGCVLTSAIDKFIYCIVTKRFDNEIRVIYSENERAKRVDQIKHELVREALKKVGIKKGIEINFIADIPSAGSGLGSSSSVLVGTLNALYHYVGHTPNAKQLAKEASEIEIDILGKPIGIQDQYIAAYGGLRFIKFKKSGRVVVEKININDGFLDDFNNNLMLFYTGKTRKSSNILRGVKKKLNTKTKILLENKKLAKNGYRELKKGNFEEIGTLMHSYWELKKDLSNNISSKAIDDMYDKAVRTGAIGGKITGAGGGGFLLLLVPSNKRSTVRKSLKNFKELPFKLERDGSKVIFNVRR